MKSTSFETKKSKGEWVVESGLSTPSINFRVEEGNGRYLISQNL